MSLQPARTKLSLWRGATYRKRFTLYQAGTDGPTDDLTGFSAEMIIRDEPGGMPLLTLSTDDDSILLGDDEGWIELVIDAEVTAELEWEVGHFDLTITAPGGDTDALIYGSITARDV